MNKTFCEYFLKYQPKATHTDFLDKITQWNVRIDRETRRVEADVTLSDHVSPKILYEIESMIKKEYSLLSMRILPHYDPTLFSASRMSEIVEEAVRVGLVNNGFFDGAVYSVEGNTVTLRIPFNSYGVDYLSASKCKSVIAAIIQSRYGISFDVKIDQTSDYVERDMERQESLDRLLSYYDKVLTKSAGEYDEMIKNAPPVSSDGGASSSGPWQRKPKITAPPSNHDASVYSALKRKIEVDTAGQAPFEGGVYKSECAGYLTVDNGIVTSGLCRFDVSSPEYILRSDIDFNKLYPIEKLCEKLDDVCYVGEVFEVSVEESRRGDRFNVTVGVTDIGSSTYIKVSRPKSECGWVGELKAGKSIAVMGSVAPNEFDGEYVVTPKSIALIKRQFRMDNAEKKRVELHVHTNMSSMDGLIVPDDLVKTAKRWGHSKIAVTDHGNVQAFPEMMKSAKKQDFDVIYGMEAYYVDDTEGAVNGDKNENFDGEFVIFDIETTGLSPLNCKITEIGAVLMRDGEIVDKYNTFVNPGVHIPENITNLTSITDEMVADAPDISVVLPQFLEFVGDRILIAHNANFDIGFIRVAAEELKIPFANTYIDTVALSRYLNPELKNHKLDTLAKYFLLGDFNHHRACDDAYILGLIFRKMTEKLHGEGVFDTAGMVKSMADKCDPSKLKTYHMIMLVENLVGLKNLYKLISASYLDYFYKKPRIPKSLLDRYREGIIIGSACEQGELFRAVLEGKSEDSIRKIAEYYDYLEIQPICNNRFLVAEGKVADDEGLRELNRRIYNLGKKLGKPVCATCDSHFLNQEDELYRKILLAGLKFKDADRDVGIYLRTTEEMLEEFSYLGEEAAYEVVVENTNLIADRCEKILPIPDGTYTPNMEGAEEDLQNSCWERAKSMYGDPLPDIVKNRLDKELTSIIKNGFAVLYMIAVKLVAYSESEGYLVGSRGSVGSSFVATMSGISEVNPLPPHYYCPKCQYNEFFTDGSVGSGFDLPDKICPRCNTKLIGDGHDIPFETFLGFYGDKSPDIDLNFSGEVQGKVHKYTEELFGEGNVFRAGTIGTLASKTAYGFVAKYLESKGISASKAEINRIITNCVGVKRTTGQHPGGIIVIPREYEVYDFTPVQHPADDPNSDIITTHFQFSYLHDTILKLDELGHDIPTKYKWLEKYTNTSVMDVPMNDPAVYGLFASTEPLGIKGEDIDAKLGTYGLPEFGTRFVMKMVEEAKPKNFADLLQISGLSHGTDVWTGNAQDLINSGTCTISNVIGCRDNIMNDLIAYGLENGLAFKIMESVRKGKGLSEEWENEMLAHNVPEWYILSCKKIKYMFPKAHAAAYVMSAIRLGWYKVNYPVEFYAAFLTVAPGGFDAEIVLGGLGAVNRYIKEVDEKGNDATQKDKELQNTLYLVREALARKIVFLPIDLYKSDAKAFTIEDGKIRLPFSALNGLGERAAQSIVEARADGEFSSKEDLKNRAQLSKSVLDVFDKIGVTSQMTETDQLTFF